MNEDINLLLDCFEEAIVSNQPEAVRNKFRDRILAVAAQHWRPIETAPKDGTRVLLHRDGWAEHTAVGWYDDVRREWRPVCGDVFPGDVIHWLPLPPAPEPDDA